MSATSFLHSSFLQAISVAMLWPVHVQKVPQTQTTLFHSPVHGRQDTDKEQKCVFR